MGMRRWAVVVAVALLASATNVRAQTFVPRVGLPALGDPNAVTPTMLTAPTSAQTEPGYLGVYADHTNEQGRGVRILAVMQNSPAQAAGLQPNDLVTSINGQTVTTVNDVATIMRPLMPNDEASFVIRRGNEVRRVDIRLGVRPPLSSIAEPPVTTASPGTTIVSPSGAPGSSIVRSPVVQPTETLPSPTAPTAGSPSTAAPTAPAGGGVLLGVRAVPVTIEMQKALNLPEPRGALVIDVRDGSPAQKFGLPLEAVIVALDGVRIDSPQQLAELVSDRGPGAEVKLSYFRLGQLSEKKVTLGGGAAVATESSPMPASPRIQVVPPTATSPVVPSVPQPVAPPSAANEETEALRRRVRELETRLAELETKLKAVGAPTKP